MDKIKNKDTRVSVVIPCYNDGEFIEQAVNSIKIQTLAPSEIIIIDDGSNKETKEVLKNITGDNIVIVYQENQGVCKARNNAIKRVKSSYVLTLDSDDFFEPSFIEKAKKILDNDSTIGVVGSYVRVFAENKMDKVLKREAGGVESFLFANNAVASSMFRKQCWDEVGGYDENMVNGYEDWEFWLAIAKNNWKFEIIKEVLFNYRRKVESRDTKARNDYDLELKKYIYIKHKDLYIKNYDKTISFLLEQKEFYKKKNESIKNTRDYKWGQLFLKPLRKIKTLMLK